MKRLVLNPVNIIFIFLISSGTAGACGFASTVILNDCPVGELDRNKGTEDSDKTMIQLSALWTIHDDFKTLGINSDINLNVCFLNPYESLVSQVEESLDKYVSAKGIVAGIPTESRLKFNTRKGGVPRKCMDPLVSHIGIEFNSENTNWSHLGNTSTNHYPSMKLSYNPDSLNISSGTIKHEFGHAVGFRHEMFHPDWRVCVDAFDAEKYMKLAGVTFGNQYTKKQQIKMAEQNMGKVAQNMLDHDVTDLDYDSIMTYETSDEYFNGMEGCGMPSNNSLSGSDIALFLKYYGRRLK